jgi:hypothetical protein
MCIEIHSTCKRGKTGIHNYGSSLLLLVKERPIGNAIDSGIDLSITIDNLRVFINKTLSILSAYQ